MDTTSPFHLQKVHIVQGPNLHKLGTREPHHYGRQSFAPFFKKLQNSYNSLSLHQFQSNHEGALIDFLHANDDAAHTGFILNLGAYTHTSLALADAVQCLFSPCIEVHISNIFARTPALRHRSLCAHAIKGMIVGLGLEGYRLGIEYLLSLSSPPPRRKNDADI